jgi:hypothetical protein
MSTVSGAHLSQVISLLGTYSGLLVMWMVATACEVLSVLSYQDKGVRKRSFLST